MPQQRQQQHRQPPLPPPTATTAPFPASAKGNSSFTVHSKERRQINGTRCVVSRSEQNFSSVKRRVEEEMKPPPRGSNGIQLRRYSVASKYASPRNEKKVDLSGSGTTAAEVKSRPKRPSFQATRCDPPKTAVKTGNLSVGRAAVKNPTASFRGSTPTKTASRKETLSKERFVKDLKPARSSLNKSTATSSRFKAGASVSPMQESRKHLQSKEKAPTIPNLLLAASYWLEHIKLSESIQKHGVSLGFFRLAAECDAEPLQLLREALVSYKKRYALCSDSLNELLSCYGSSEKDQELGTLEGPENTQSDKNSALLNSILTTSCQTNNFPEPQTLSEECTGGSNPAVPENDSREFSNVAGSVHGEEMRELLQDSDEDLNVNRETSEKKDRRQGSTQRERTPDCSGRNRSDPHVICIPATSGGSECLASTNDALGLEFSSETTTEQMETPAESPASNQLFSQIQIQQRNASSASAAESQGPKGPSQVGIKASSRKRSNVSNQQQTHALRLVTISKVEQKGNRGSNQKNVRERATRTVKPLEDISSGRVSSKNKKQINKDHLDTRCPDEVRMQDISSGRVSSNNKKEIKKDYLDTCSPDEVRMQEDLAEKGREFEMESENPGPHPVNPAELNNLHII